MSESAFGLSTIGQIAVAARDLARSTRFCRDVPGLPFLFDVPGKLAFFLDAERTVLALMSEDPKG